MLFRLGLVRPEERVAMQRRPLVNLITAALTAIAAAGVAIAVAGTAASAVDHETCRPDGLYRTPGVATPYCHAYDSNGRELMGTGHARRVIGYFTSWRHGKDGRPSYLAGNIPPTSTRATRSPSAPRPRPTTRPPT
jgi:chitinase